MLRFQNKIETPEFINLYKYSKHQRPNYTHYDTSRTGKY